MEHSECPVEKALNIIGKKWVVLIIKNLVNGSQRFCSLEASLNDITPAMLSARLKELEEHGILKRKVFTESPIKVEYELTKKGRDLEKVIDSISDWGTSWL